MTETDLVYYLLSDSSILALIGTSSSPVNARIYPLILKQNTDVPAITYTKISSQRPELLDGSNDLAFTQYQISCYANTPKAVWQLADLVAARMSGVGGVNFQKAGIQDVREDYEQDTQRYRQDVDVQIAHA